MSDIKLEKTSILKASVNGMSFEFVEIKPEDGTRLNCSKICPISDICDRLPNPEFPKDENLSFVDFCGKDELEDTIPRTTKSEIKEMYKKVGYDIRPDEHTLALKEAALKVVEEYMNGGCKDKSLWDKFQEMWNKYLKEKEIGEN